MTVALIGYARVSTEDQDTAGQRLALEQQGCALIFEDRASGGSRDGSVANSDTVSKIGLMYCQGQLR